MFLRDSFWHHVAQFLHTNASRACNHHPASFHFAKSQQHADNLFLADTSAATIDRHPGNVASTLGTSMGALHRVPNIIWEGSPSC